MTHGGKILPDTGRGTIRRMVEGAHARASHKIEKLAPRSLRQSRRAGLPPPRPGEDRREPPLSRG